MMPIELIHRLNILTSWTIHENNYTLQSYFAFNTSFIPELIIPKTLPHLSFKRPTRWKSHYNIVIIILDLDINIRYSWHRSIAT